jgi:hypothetical protein
LTDLGNFAGQFRFKAGPDFWERAAARFKPEILTKFERGGFLAAAGC